MDEDYGTMEPTEAAAPPAEAGLPPATPQELALIKRIQARVEDDKKAHKDAFERMRRDQMVARRGATKQWPEGNYVANITNRHINQTTAALYAKNPKAVARRRPRLDFQIWDESEQSLTRAITYVTSVMNAAMASGVPMDPMTGLPLVPDPMFQQNLMILQDFEAGMQARRQVDAVGKTLVALFHYYMQEQRPVPVKKAMKSVVRRAATCGVAYVELDWQQEWVEDADTVAQIADYREQLAQIRLLAEKTQSAEAGEAHEADQEELRVAIEALQAQQYVLSREGLAFSFPRPTQVIPDRACTNVVGFIDAKWVTVEEVVSVDEVRRRYRVDIGKEKFARYTPAGVRLGDAGQGSLDFGDDADRGDHVCIWRCFDRLAGVVYHVADGYERFLQPPAPPGVYVESFWPVYAVSFNETEDEEPFPLSDVTLMLDMQMDYNRLRQGLREHRQAARPRYGMPKGALSDEEKARFRDARAHDVVEFTPMGPDPDVRKVIQPVPLSGVDPNLYETGQTFTDVQVVVGSQEAQFGAVAKATATESSIAEGSRVASVDSKVDDLDEFLTDIARAAGQILLQKVTPELAARIAGRGAVWPQLTLDEIADELYLEIEAGSSGKPNQAADLANWERMLPYLIQIPSIPPEWLAREVLRRLDDRMDLTDAIAEGVPAVVSLNRMAQPAGAGGPQGDPNAQGGEGGDNGPRPQEPDGSQAPMGNNQV